MFISEIEIVKVTLEFEHFTPDLEMRQRFFKGAVHGHQTRSGLLQCPVGSSLTRHLQPWRQGNSLDFIKPY